MKTQVIKTKKMAIVFEFDPILFQCILSHYMATFFYSKKKVLLQKPILTVITQRTLTVSNVIINISFFKLVQYTTNHGHLSSRLKFQVILTTLTNVSIL